ncbi:uncharacterized protein LOC110617977, partial [Manihot esculenta]|uniref:uncharacterized protein LOC110617977 n=1 Tax=Manihot esculenta TaxID=3983 RepID=UPI001CC71C19
IPRPNHTFPIYLPLAALFSPLPAVASSLSIIHLTSILNSTLFPKQLFLACGVSTSPSNGSVSVDSSWPEPTASVDSLTDDFKNQNLGPDASLNDKIDHSINNNSNKVKFMLEDLIGTILLLENCLVTPEPILFPVSGNPKEEPGAIVCRVAQSFLCFGS